MSFSKRQQKEDPSVPVPVGPLKKRRHEGQYLVGGQRQRDIPVFLQTQGGSGAPLGNPEREPQKNDLSEDGTGAAQLRQNRGGEEDQEEADVPVQRRGAGEEERLRVGGTGSWQALWLTSHHVFNLHKLGWARSRDQGHKDCWFMGAA